jgi:hypothetical protein
MTTENGRTHEPSLRELCAELDGFKALMTERDRRYTDTVEGIRRETTAALTAAVGQIQAAFAASDKAILKAEDAQRAYNQGHNDLSRKMDDQYKAMVPQSEARLKWENADKDIAELRKDLIAGREGAQRDSSALRAELMKEIAGLRESRSEGSGRSSQQREGRESNQWAIATGIALAGLCVGALGSLAYIFTHMRGVMP